MRNCRFFCFILVCLLAVFLIAPAAGANDSLNDISLSLQEILDRLAEQKQEPAGDGEAISTNQSSEQTDDNELVPESEDAAAGTTAAGDCLVLNNEVTGYSAVILDQAELLTDEEENELLRDMLETTQYCNAICFTNTDTYSGSEIQYGGRKMERICEELDLDSYTAVLFMIDMYKRKVAICPSVNIYQTITTDISNTITDNIYTYASRGDYAGTVRETFLQIFKVFDGQKIAQPMRYITAALLALFAGFAISLILVRTKTRREKAGFDVLVKELSVNECEPNVSVNLLSTRKVRHVEVSGGGGGGGGGFSGGGGGGFSGGGGGGGFSGGGGSHSF